jgi:hypothetical protein
MEMDYQRGWDDAMAQQKALHEELSAVLQKGGVEALTLSPLARAYVDVDALADYKAGRMSSLQLFRVAALGTDVAIIILAAPEGEAAHE